MAKKEHRKPSYPAALRMARIAFELPSHPFGWPLEAIQRDLDISERTLKRYLAAGKDALVDRLGRPYFKVVSDGGKTKLRLPAFQKPVECAAYQGLALLHVDAFEISRGNRAQGGHRGLMGQVREEPTAI